MRPHNSFTQGMVKIQSLDFGERDETAHKYRMKLLEKTKKEGSVKNKPVSKLGEDLRKKKEKQDSTTGEGSHGGHDIVDNGEKASFGQCTFNMANILMVRLDEIYQSFFASSIEYFLIQLCNCLY